MGFIWKNKVAKKSSKLTRNIIFNISKQYWITCGVVTRLNSGKSKWKTLPGRIYTDSFIIYSKDVIINSANPSHHFKEQIMGFLLNTFHWYHFVSYCLLIYKSQFKTWFCQIVCVLDPQPDLSVGKCSLYV